jgi:S-adenosylmethionine decarboxylase
MIDPDEEVMSHFCYDHNKPLSEDVRHRMGFSNIYEEEDVKIDDYCFDSCGYSLNGSVNNHYFTLHVTPQEQSSYVSFETSLREDNTFARVQKLLNIFKPSKALLVLYDVSGSSVYNEDSDLWRIEEYTEILSLGYYMKAYQLKKKE